MEFEGSTALSGCKLPSHITEKTRNSYGVHDTLRYGFASAKENIEQPSPPSQTERQEAIRMQVLRNTQGRHMPLLLQMERSIVSKVQRMPPLESSMIALETLTGMDTRLSVEEIFNPPSEALVTVDTHLAMQHKLKMN